MLNHIEKLNEATKELRVSYRYAYNDGPDIGVRGYNLNEKVDGICYQGCLDDTVVIDGIAWLIAGDIWSIVTTERVRDLEVMPVADLDNLRVPVRAQACVGNRVVIVRLGTRRISVRYPLDNGEGVLALTEER